MSQYVNLQIRPLSGEERQYVVETLDRNTDIYGKNYIEDYPHSHFYGVYDKENYLYAFFCICHWEHGNEAVLACVYVKEAHRNRGIFNKIVKFFIKKCPEIPLLTIGAMITNTLANEIYDRMFKFDHYDEDTNGKWYIVKDRRQ